MEYLLATLTGVIVGAIFTFLNLPIPAPPTLAGILGIVGVYIGYLIVKNLAL